jgi:uncharacterized protein (DUF1697 family)
MLEPLMSRYIAFLRAINLGSSRAVKMETLRQVFESSGFSHVTTWLASGNIIFETLSRNSHTLTKKIEERLREALGYEVPVFIRTEKELSEIAAKYGPTSPSENK